MPNMFKDFFESLKVELTGVAPDVKVGIPYSTKNGAPSKEVTIYITFINIERIDRLTSTANIRVLFTAYIREDELDEEAVQLDALDAIDDIISYLSENKSSYTLIPTPENMTNNIWSAFRIPLRPFLIYECPVSLAT